MAARRTPKSALVVILVAAGCARSVTPVADANVPDAEIASASDAREDRAVDALPDIGGCWILRTDTGDARLDLSQMGTSVTGTWSWPVTTPQDIDPIEDGAVSVTSLTFHDTQTTGGQTCYFTFDAATSTRLAGTVHCLASVQPVTGDRTCP